MALQPAPNYQGFALNPLPQQPFGDTLTSGVAVVDGVGESVFAIGYINLATGPGTSKTFANGGKIFWKQGAATFANATTFVNFGAENVTAAGVEDGVFDVAFAAQATVDTITANVVNALTFGVASGTMTIAHGDLVAIGCECVTRGGADTLSFPRTEQTMIMAHGSVDTGAGPTIAGTAPFFAMTSDDGTLAWFDGLFPFITDSSASFNSGSTPDEYALVFQLPWKAVITALGAAIAGVAVSDDFDLILYSDPLGTPVAERTIAFDMSLGFPVTSGNGMFTQQIANYTLLANTKYAIALRPSTTNNLVYQRINFGSGNGTLRQATQLGVNWSTYSRTNQTGAFGSEDITTLPIFWGWLSQFDDGAGSSGGGGSVFGARGGVIT